SMIDAGRSVELVRGIGRFIHNELVVDARVPAAGQMDKLADALASIEYYLEAAREHRGGLGHILDVTEQSLAQLGYWPVPDMRDADVAVSVPPPAASDVPADEIVPVEPQAETHPDLTGPVSMPMEEAASEPAAPDAPPAADDATGEPASAAPAPEPVDEAGDWIEIEEEIQERVAVPDAMAARAGFQGAADEIDDEIREVFLEE